MHTHTRLTHMLTSCMWLTCTLQVARGDDGTDHLSSCSSGAIERDEAGIIRCAPPPRAGTDAPSQPNDSTDGRPAQRSGESTPAAPAGGEPDASAEMGGAAANGGSGEPAPSGQPDASAASGQSGSGLPAAGGGAPATPAPSPRKGSLPSGGTWYCLEVMNACSCVMGTIAMDNCTSPRPTCCVQVENDADVLSCVCYPEGSAECTGVTSDPASYPPVERCPP